MGQENDSQERLQKFRVLAQEAWQSARRAQTPEMKREYENLALAWGELIAELEKLETKASSRTH